MPQTTFVPTFWPHIISELGGVHHFLDSRAEIVKFFRWYFGPNDDTKGHFEIN